MNLCDAGHDEVCFDQRNCPVCLIIAETGSEIKDLKETIADLEGQIFDLESELKSI